MTHRFARILRHRWVSERDARRVIDDAARARLEARVAASERQHSGEIRLCIEAGLPWSYLWQGLSPRSRAVMLFGKLRVWDTEANNGVLIYLLLADHAIEIVADRALSRHVPPEQWRAIVESMREAFRDGRFEEGLAAAIDAVDALLVRHFALAPGQRNANELPDRTVLR